MELRETDEQQLLRESVAALAGRFGGDYFLAKAKSGEKTTELWAEAGKAGYLGVAVPPEYGGGGAGMVELAIVAEEIAAAGCPLLLIVVSPAIVATVIATSGTAEQKERWLPGFADGSLRMSFAITEPDAGSNSHRITTTARRDPDGGWRLSGHKYYISGVDETDATLVVARMEDAASGTLRPAMFVVPRDTPGLTYQPIDMAIVSPERQFTLFFDDAHLPADALVGGEEAGLSALFAGLNPERITVAAYSNGLARYALGKGVAYAKDRDVWGTPIGAHQAIAHPLAAAHIDVELARMATTRAAFLYDAGDRGAGDAANIAKYAAAEAAIKAVDASVQAHGGNGMSLEYGVGALIGSVRAARIAPVSREMVLNHVAQHALGLPKSY
ncbi:MAG: acyl-CoA dehydrogenase [Pseudonocardia sp.]|uniref:acyl-CoA dehydrogenase family protein n=1 Tax=unclassified Pseudonocardia TaxID=2619320 RepID=UPI00086A4199|nr:MULTISPECIES: acyl-CoA dehydrogenase [unclassified Pseudonocardia]MBN9109984.1 acyl-CoA dehydrogenase [Pseudonocardia sp.]ODU25380.1 MAG: acyl-CoA dehydrogenase [Pseudonocardia sp. SCN 72-51]ODV03301.1 MAG: acyl-CoA dehydrogenase [Pseudonocardia sp. SCN 73-27]